MQFCEIGLQFGRGILQVVSSFVRSIVLLKIASMNNTDMEGLIDRIERLLNKVTGTQLSRSDFKTLQQLTENPHYEQIIKNLMFKQLLSEYQVFITK